MTSVSPSLTFWPTWHSIFQTVPVMWASTSGKVASSWSELASRDDIRVAGDVTKPFAAGRKGRG